MILNAPNYTVSSRDVRTVADILYVCSDDRFETTSDSSASKILLGAILLFVLQGCCYHNIVKAIPLFTK